VRRGKVWWHEPPNAKRRPLVILTRDESIDVLYDLVVCPSDGRAARWLLRRSKW